MNTSTCRMDSRIFSIRIFPQSSYYSERDVTLHILQRFGSCHIGLDSRVNPACLTLGLSCSPCSQAVSRNRASFQENPSRLLPRCTLISDLLFDTLFTLRPHQPDISSCQTSFSAEGPFIHAEHCIDVPTNPRVSMQLVRFLVAIYVLNGSNPVMGTFLSEPIAVEGTNSKPSNLAPVQNAHRRLLHDGVEEGRY